METASKFISILHESESIVEIRSPNCPDRKGGKYLSTASGYFSDHQKAVEESLKLDALEPAGVYITMNPCKPELLARGANRITHKAKQTTADSDILKRRWLILDLDPVRPSGVSSTNDELKSAMRHAISISEEMVGQGWPSPVRCMSGNGTYLLYRIDLPNTDESRDLIKKVLEAFHQEYSTEVVNVDRTMFNAARIIKVIGTWARKGDSLVGVDGILDRPHRKSALGTMPDNIGVVSHEQLTKMAALVKEPPKPKPRLPYRSNGEYRKFDHTPAGVRDYLESFGVGVASERTNNNGTMLVLERCPITDAEGGSSVGVLIENSGKISFSNLHDRGVNLQWMDLRDHLEPGYRLWAEAQSAPKPIPTPVTTPKKLNELAAFSHAELQEANIPKVHWVVNGIIPEGLTVLAGKPKTGKSIFAMNMLYTVATGQMALGSFPVSRGKCLYLALEDNKRRLRDRLEAIRREGPISEGLFMVEQGGFPRLDEGGLDILRSYLSSNKDCRLVVIDTWARICPKRNKGSTLYEADADSWEILFKLAHETNTAIVALHHTRKTLGFNGDWMEELSGSSGVSGTADTILLFDRARGENMAVLKVGGREVDEEAEYALEGHPQDKTWTMVGDAETVFSSEQRKEIVKALSTGAMWPNQISDYLGKSEGSVRKLLHSMKNDGQLMVDQHGKYAKIRRDLPFDGKR